MTAPSRQPDTIGLVPPDVAGRIFDRWILVLLAASLGYAVLHRGAFDFTYLSVSLMIIGLTSAMYWLRKSRSEFAQPIQPWHLWIGLLLGYVALQLVPLPLFILRFVSPGRAGLWYSLRNIMTAPALAPITIDFATTVQYLCRFIGYALLFLLVREIACRFSNRQSWAFATPLIAVAAIEAMLGLLQAAQGVDAVTGTYANKNHLAGLLEMILPICVAGSVALWNSQFFLKSFPIFRALSACAVLLVGLLIFAGLVASASKMGLFSCLCGLLIPGGVVLWTRLRAWSKWLALGGLAVSVLYFVIFVPSDKLMAGFVGLFSDQTGEGRFLIWADTIHLIGSYPVFGVGLGNYGAAMQKFQTQIIDRDYTFAHNDYLQSVSELGTIGFVIAGIFFIAIFSKGLRASIRARDRNVQLLGLACVGSMTAIGMHSLADFNLYMPANAMVLAWISGIAASLDVPRERRMLSSRDYRGLRVVALTLGFLVIVYASSWTVFEKDFADKARFESVFCHFGICDTESVLAAESREYGGKISALPLPELSAALRRNSASPTRWCDLGEALSSRGRIKEARYCFATAVALGPYVPFVLLRAAGFDFGTGDFHRAFEESSRVLSKTDAYDDMVFQRYRAQQLPLDKVLNDGLPGTRASRAYLRYQMGIYNQPAAAAVWGWDVGRNYVDDTLARDYVTFLWSYRQYEAAARALASYLGSRRRGYLDSDFIYNGDFETEPLSVPLDWHLENLGDDVQVVRDTSVAHTGTHSLRFTFGGNSNVDYNETYETAFVTPGMYRFEAFVRTQDLTTDQGIGFHVFDQEQPGRLDMKTIRLSGTHDWEKVQADVIVPQATKLLTIQIVRPQSWRFDSLIKGTAWVDSVRLLKLQ